jgi:hypothetical protein
VDYSIEKRMKENAGLLLRQPGIFFVKDDLL